MQSSPDDLTFTLTKNRGWYSIRLDFGDAPHAVRLVALVNPAAPFSFIMPDAIDQLMRWEFVPLVQQDRLRLSGITVQGKAIPDLVVRRRADQRNTPWEVVVGSDFFAYFRDLHLDLDTSVVRLTRG